MTVYVARESTKWQIGRQRVRMSYMCADSEEEMQEAAERVGSCSYWRHSNYHMYAITQRQKRDAVAAGAEEVPELHLWKYVVPVVK